MTNLQAYQENANDKTEIGGDNNGPSFVLDQTGRNDMADSITSKPVSMLQPQIGQRESERDKLIYSYENISMMNGQVKDSGEKK